MLDKLRRSLARVAGALAFLKVYPPKDQALVVLSAKLEAGNQRAAALIQSRGERDKEARTATEQAEGIRRRLKRGLLPLFARAGLAAAADKPELVAAFRPLKPGTTRLDFAAAAGSLIEATRTNAEAVAGHGVTAELVEEAAALLVQFTAAVDRGLQGRNARVGAVAELRVVVRELMDLVARIDRFHRHRFAEDPETMAAWESAKAVAGPIAGRVGKAEAGPEGGPGTAGSSGTGGTAGLAA